MRVPAWASALQRYNEAHSDRLGRTPEELGARMPTRTSSRSARAARRSPLPSLLLRGRRGGDTSRAQADMARARGGGGRA